MKVKVNEENCIACGYCVGVCDKVFEFIDSENGTVSHVKVDEVADEDKEAVKKIFSALSDYIERMDYSVQIIITEHADEDVWGDVDNVHLVERWRGEDNKLVPLSWL